MPELFRHEALPYRGQGRFVASAATAVRDGLDNDERTIVLAPTTKLEDLRDALGDDGDDVTLVPTDEHGRNPSRIATILHSFHIGGDGRSALGISDYSLPRRSRAALAEVRFSDCALNTPALRSWPLSVVCLFDLDELDETGTHAMRQSHAVIRGEDTNVDYDPGLAEELFGQPLEPAPPHAPWLDVDRPALSDMRSFVRSISSAFGVAADRVDDLVLAANEIVTNSLRHGGGRGHITMWFAEGAVVCEVRDAGHITDPLAGRFAPPPAATSGRGLWLANHLCDLVQLRSSAAGTTVRMYVDR